MKKKENNVRKLVPQTTTVTQDESITNICQKEASRISTFFRSNLMTIILIPLCIALAYMATLHFIGDGAYKYSDSTYQYIEDVITGGSKINHETGEIIEKAVDAETGEPVYGVVAPEMGFDSLYLMDTKIQTFALTFNDGVFHFVCSIKDGYFFAEVTAEISKDYEVTSVTRNYKSFAQYKNTYDIIFGVSVILGGIVLYFAIILGWFGIVKVWATLGTAFKKKATDGIAGENNEKDSTDLVQSAEHGIQHIFNAVNGDATL